MFWKKKIIRPEEKSPNESEQQLIKIIEEHEKKNNKFRQEIQGLQKRAESAGRKNLEIITRQEQEIQKLQRDAERKNEEIITLEEELGILQEKHKLKLHHEPSEELLLQLLLKAKTSLTVSCPEINEKIIKLLRANPDIKRTLLTHKKPAEDLVNELPKVIIKSSKIKTTSMIIDDELAVIGDELCLITNNSRIITDLKTALGT